jgi:hypothetical protein
MVTVDRHNGIVELGPCGMPWNYDDHFVILPQVGLDQCGASQLEIYQHGRLTVGSGSLSIDREKKKISINLTLLTQEGSQKVFRPFAYNGTYDFTVEDPTPGMPSRKWLQDFYRDKKPEYYIVR